MISVIIPVYNREKTISRAIDSVLGQTYSDIELIIVDDCSTDNTRKIIEKYNDSRIRYIINEKNSGACASRNRGISEAKGEYIAFQDSDDFWRPNKLETQIKKIQETDSDVCFCRFQLHGYPEAEGKIEPMHQDGLIPHEALVEHNLVGTITIVAKSDVFSDFSFDDELKKLQDYDWVIRASKKYNFYLCDDVLADAYLQPDSITKSMNYEKAIDALIQKYQKENIDDVVSVMLNKKANIQSYNMKDASRIYMEAYNLSGEKMYMVKAILSKLRLMKLAFMLKGIKY